MLKEREGIRCSRGLTAMLVDILPTMGLTRIRRTLWTDQLRRLEVSGSSGTFALLQYDWHLEGDGTLCHKSLRA